MSTGIEVYKSICAVQTELSKEGITKSRKNQQQGYNFRGIDEVYNAISPLLAKHNLCILPRMLSRSQTERETQKGGVLFYTIVEAEFDFVSAEDGSKHTVKTYGEAMDSADKSTNKAMSAAYKYAAFQAFAIPTEGDNDADAHTHQVSRPVTPVKAVAQEIQVSPERMELLKNLAAELVHLIEAEGRTNDALDMLDHEKLDNESKIILWDILAPNSKTRAAIKKGKV